MIHLDELYCLEMVMIGELNGAIHEINTLFYVMFALFYALKLLL